MNFNQNFGRNSEYINNISSTILGIRHTNTTYSNSTTDMSKSKIQNLPNHKKNPLGDNLPFVVVFQGIQIQRLTNQLQSMRIKIKDYEDKIFNAGSYEVQIKQLTQKLFEMQRQKSYYLDQNQKIKIVSQQLYHQIEEWKRKYSEIDFTLKDKLEAEKKRNSDLLLELERWHTRFASLQKAKMKQLQDMRMMMQSQRKSMLDRQIRQLNMKFNSQRGYLEGQIRKLRQSLQFKIRQIDELKHKIQRLEMSMSEYRSLEAKVVQYQTKIATFSQELMRLNDVLKGKQQDAQNWRVKTLNLQNQIRMQMQWQNENKNLKQGIQMRMKQIQEWKSKYNRIQEQLNTTKMSLRQIDQLNGRLVQLSKQNQRLNSILRSKIDQIQNWRVKTEKANQKINQYRTLQYQIEEYQKKLAMMTSEIERLNNLLKQRLGQIQSWKNRYTQAQHTCKNFTNLQNQYRDLQNQIQFYVKSIQQLKSNNTRLQGEISRFKHIQMKLQESQRRAMSLNQQIDRLNGLVRGKIDQIDDQRVKYQNLQYQFNQYRLIENKITEYQNKIALLTQQIERLNNINRQKGGQIDQFMSKLRKLQDQVTFYKTFQAKISSYQSQMNSLYSTIEEQKRQYSNLQNQFYKAKSLQRKLEEYENKISMLSQQVQRLSRVLNTKHSEIQEFKSTIMRYQSQIFHLKQSQRSMMQMQKKISYMTSQIQKLNGYMRDKDMQLNHQKKGTTQLALKVIVLSTQLQRAYQTIQQINSSAATYTQKIYQLEKHNSSLQIKSSDLQSNNKYLVSQIQRYKMMIKEYQTKIYDMQTEFQQYRKYKQQIIILGRQIDRLQYQNKQYQEDIKKLRLRYSDTQSLIKKNQSYYLQLVFMMTFVMLMTEIEALRSRVSAKERQVQQVRKSILMPARSVKY